MTEPRNTPVPIVSWRSWAACAHDPTTTYFTSAHPPACDRCPAAEPCLWASLAADQTSGYPSGHWGGASAARRARIAAQLGADVDYPAVAAQAAADWQPPTARRRSAA